MLYSIAQTDADLAAVFSKWYTGTTEHRMHYDSVYTKISANSGVDQGCPLSTCGFSAAVDPALRSVLADICTQHDSGAKLFAYLDDWYLWIKPQYLLQTVAVITAATRSVNLALESTKTQVWKGSCQDPFHLNSKTRSHSPSAVWVDIYKSMETLSPALLFWVSRPPWRKQHNAFRRLPPHLQTSTPRDSMCRQ